MMHTDLMTRYNKKCHSIFKPWEFFFDSHKKNYHSWYKHHTTRFSNHDENVIFFSFFRNWSWKNRCMFIKRLRNNSHAIETKKPNFMFYFDSTTNWILSILKFFFNLKYLSSYVSTNYFNWDILCFEICEKISKLKKVHKSFLFSSWMMYDYFGCVHNTEIDSIDFVCDNYVLFGLEKFVCRLVLFTLCL